MISIEEILSQIDNQSITNGSIDYSKFPGMLGDDYNIFHICARLHLFKNTSEWAIIIEHCYFFPRAGGLDEIPLQLFPFGNCILDNDLSFEFQRANRIINFAKYKSLPSDYDEFYGERVPEGDVMVLLRGVEYEIIRGKETYEKHGIKIDEEKPLYVQDLARMLFLKFPDKFRALPQELRKLIPDHLNEIMTLDEWYHPYFPLDKSSKPSDFDTFKMFGKVLATGNIAEYQPTVNSNTHWKYWVHGTKNLDENI